MRILVTGREGQVVQSLLERGRAAGHEIVALGRPELDLTAPWRDIETAIAAARPEAIVSAAAYTAVDKAEGERDLAFRVNAEGAGNVARAAESLSVPLVHLSTDYVFDGSKPAAYTEADEPNPASVYGESKLAGEKAVAEAHKNSAIVRTAWVYSPNGSNFVKTMLRLAETRDEVSVVADQVGSPSSALDIADGVITILANMMGRDEPGLRGLFHMSGSGQASWAEFAEAIFATSKAHGGPSAVVRRIPTSDYPTAAKRPSNSRLDCAKLESAHHVRLPDWHASMETAVVRILSQSAERVTQ